MGTAWDGRRIQWFGESKSSAKSVFICVYLASISTGFSMTRLDELTLKLADSELSESGASELALLLGQDARLLKDHVRLLELEASLRGQRTNMQLAEATMAQLRSHLAGTLTDRVMSEIKTGADRSADAH